jgi:hypothetical protein
MMHPAVYSYLKPLYDLEQVAEFLGYQDHSVWRQKVEVAKQDRSVQSLLRNALKPGSRNEASFSIVFSVLAPMIAYAIEPEFDLQYLLKTRCKTGGIWLAQSMILSVEEDCITQLMLPVKQCLEQK